MTAGVSFQGLSTNLPTDQIIAAVMQQESVPLTRMQAKQTLNNTRSTLLSTLSVDLLSLSASIGTLSSTASEANTVTSSDSTNSYVSAVASGAANGNYDVLVHQVAKAAQVVVALPSQSSGSSASSISLGGTVGTDGNYHYTVTNIDGTATDISLSSSNNTLAGLRDAINSSSSTSDVSATVIQTDAAGKQFSLVLSGTSTGLGSSGGTSVSIASAASNSGNQVALGTQTSSAAQDAKFSVNGIELERSSNTVTDAVSGMTLTLKAGGQLSTGTPTTLTVGTDSSAITTAFQDVVSKFNAVLTLYKDNSSITVTPDSSSSSSTSSSSSSSGTSSDSTVTVGALANDQTLRTLISKIRSQITSVASGLSSSNAYHSTVELGIKTNQDGTMSLDTTAFKTALAANPSAAANVFSSISSVVQGTIYSITSPGSGDLALIRQSIDTQNSFLNLQINQMTTYLDRRKSILETQYANLEVMVGQMQAAGQSLSSL